MFPNVVSRGALPTGTTPGITTDVIPSLAALFCVTRPIAAENVARLYWLGALMIAGAFVRFWGLGAVGLHGDEETMAMAVRHILIDGRPILPSGMFYPRGLTQLYLMALSVSVFGESEWALRLPSALCGVALIPLSYCAGRRFLRPHWNLAFAAAMAFLPALIIDAQTARMYIFLVTLITAAMATVFAWERTGGVGWLLAGVGSLVLALDMHALAVAAVLLFLSPGLLRGNVRMLVLGVAAAGVVVAAYFVIHTWVEAQYPAPSPEFAASVGPPPPQSASAPRDFQSAFDAVLWAMGVGLAIVAMQLVRVIPRRTFAATTAVLLLAGVGLQLALYYHLAAFAYGAAIVIAMRHGGVRSQRALGVLLLGIGLLAVVHVALLASGSSTLIKLVGALVGQPSLWPYVRLAELSPVAGVLTAALLGWGVYELAHRRPVADYWLLAVLTVWAPVFALGAFAWNVPPRYTEMALAPMLLCAFAFAQGGVQHFLSQRASHSRGVISASAAAVAAAVIINPVAAVAAVTSGYRTHPDHKGAAEFLRTQHIVDDDIVAAEDVLQQTYYLRKVDYWLIGPQVARQYVRQSGDGVVDFYTGTPVIATPAMLDRLLEENRNRRIFIVGTGEGWVRGRRSVRGELQTSLASERFETIYTGRDGLTQILRARSDRATPLPSVRVRSEADEAALVKAATAASREKARVRAPATTPAAE